MNEFDELEALIQSMPLEWQCAAPGLRRGVDNDLDAVITVHGSRVLDGLRPASDSTAATHDGLKRLRLTVAAEPGITIVPLSAACGSLTTLGLPDLSWDATLSVALRFRVPAAVARPTHPLAPLARVTLSADATSVEGARPLPIELHLNMGAAVLSNEEYDSFPEDPETLQMLSDLIGRPIVPQRAAESANASRPH